MSATNKGTITDGVKQHRIYKKKSPSSGYRRTDISSLSERVKAFTEERSMARIRWMNYRKRRQKARIYVRLIPSRECLCSEFSLAQQKRTKEGLGPVLAGQRGSAHRTDMKLSGFIRQHRGTQGDDGNSTLATLDTAGCAI